MQSSNHDPISAMLPTRNHLSQAAATLLPRPTKLAGADPVSAAVKDEFRERGPATAELGASITGSRCCFWLSRRLK